MYPFICPSMFTHPFDNACIQARLGEPWRVIWLAVVLVLTAGQLLLAPRAPRLERPTVTAQL